MANSARGLTTLVVLLLACSCGAGGTGTDGPAAGLTGGSALGSEPEQAAGVQIFPNDRRVSHNEGTDARIPSVAAWDDHVYVAWEDGRYDGTNVYFNRSTDGGATWRSVDTRIDHAAKVPLSAMVPEVACEGDLVVIVWMDDRDGLSDVFLNRSTDRGVTWLPYDVRLDTDLPGAGDSAEPQVAIEEGAVYVTWTDMRSGAGAVHFSMSPDGGTTWPVSDRRIDMNTTPGSGSIVPYVSVRGSFVYVDWEDGRSSPGAVKTEVYGRMSPDGGRDWAKDGRVSRSTPGTAYVGARELARAGEAIIYSSWTDDRMCTTGTYAMNVYFNRSLDAGFTWERRDVDLTQQPGTTPTIFGHGMAAWGERLCVAWTRELPSGAFTIHARRSDDAGQGWTLAPENVLHAPGTVSTVWGPEAASTGDHAFFAWIDDRAGVSKDVYLNAAPWTGAFAATDTRLNVPPSGATAAQFLDVATSDGAAYVGWNDDRHGYQAIYLNTARP